MEQEIESPEAGRNDDAPDGLLVRTFAAEVTAGDGRTLDVRIVPYGQRITHNDGLGGVPKGVPYTEEWMPGAFADQARAAEVGRAKHVLVNFEHEEGLRGVIGHGVMLREAPDAFYGSFRIHEGPDGDKALMLTKEGILEGVSLEAIGKKSIRMADGVVRRVKAHLRNIALCRNPAYEGAVVLAIRTAPLVLDEELLPAQIDPELIARCERLGIAIPERMKAHPVETDTPAEAGTSEDGTRQDSTLTTS